MRKILILTDSTADLGDALYQKHQIKVLPLLVTFKDTVLQDGIEINSEKLFNMVQERDDELPKTAAVPPSEFIKVFEEYIKKDYDILYLGIGSTLSATHNSAKIAKEEFPAERIALVDSLNLSSGSGLLLLKAAKMRDEGKGLAEIAAELTRLVPLLSVQFSIDRLDYLHKGGRCSSLALWFGRLLRIHPMIKVIKGKLDVYHTPKGKYVRAMNALLDEFDLHWPHNIDPDNIMITHTHTKPEYSQYLFDALVSRGVKPENIHDTTAGAVISSHCGPDTIGILYIQKDLSEKQKKKDKKENDKKEKEKEKHHKDE